MPWDFALILIVLGLVVPWQSAARIRDLLARPSLDRADRIALYISTMGLQTIAALLVLWRATARGLDPFRLGIAIPESERAFTAALALTASIATVQIYGLRRLARLPPERQGLLAQIARKLMPQAPNEFVLFALLAATVALCEEFVYRGFVFELFNSMAYGSPALAALASSLLFALAHLYQGNRGVAATFVVGLLFAAAREWSGSLLPSVLAHFVVDLLGGLLGRLLRHSAPETGQVRPESKS